jgi:hypothetical protein
MKAGGRDFSFEIAALDVPDAAGADALCDVERLVHGSGGRLSWSTGSPVVCATAEGQGHLLTGDHPA